MKIREIVADKSIYSIKCPYKMTPTRIIVHNTANDASAENEIKYMQNNENQVSFHIAVDDKEAVQGIPLDRNTWNAGDGKNGIGNRQGISIEICYSKSGGAKFVQAEKNAALLIAEMLTERGWGIDKVTKHQDYSGKYCPHRTLDMGWDRFVAMIKANMTSGSTYADTYSHDGLTFRRVKNFAITYHDLPKKTVAYKGYAEINGGFFASFKSSGGVKFTLPVANLVCDIDLTEVTESAHKYLEPYISAGKLRYSTIINQSSQFKGQKPSTLIVPASGKPYIADVASAPAGCKYAISGVPTVRDGDDVDYYNYVKAQGWDDSCMYATYRHWLGVRDGEIWCISGKTYTKNYIYGMEFWNKVKGEGFDDIICIDGGGSYYIKDKTNKVSATAENRQINTKIRL